MTPKVQLDQIVLSSIVQLTCYRKRHPNEYDYKITAIPNVNSIKDRPRINKLSEFIVCKSCKPNV